MDLEDVEYHYLKLQTKGKSQSYLRKSEILEVKHRTRRQGKCVGAALEFCGFLENTSKIKKINQPQIPANISNDIWFHLANYIAPEEVSAYSLICCQSANSVNSRGFWLQLYRKFCLKSACTTKKWILTLPEHLQIQHLKDCDRNTLRQKVIQALFFCYPPFKERLQTPYSLETLIGRSYISSWHKQIQCVWIMCYKFKLSFPLTTLMTTAQREQTFQENSGNNIQIDRVVNDWESLADDTNNNLLKIQTKSSNTVSTSTINELDGISLLVIFCDRFIPFSSDIIYNHATSPFRLAASRELLSTDMRSINLELDFISSTRDQTITVKYSKIEKYKVLPWWHPDFRILNNV